MKLQTSSQSESSIFSEGAFVRIEVPMDDRDSRRRCIPHSLCRMVIGIPERGDFPLLLTRMIEAWRPSGTAIAVVAENEFHSVTKLPLQDQKATLLQLNPPAILGTDVAGIVSVLSTWEAEAHTIFFGDRHTLGVVLSREAESGLGLGARSTDNFQERYLRSITSADPFVFLAHGHPAAELIGTMFNVLRCFDSVRAMLVDSSP